MINSNCEICGGSGVIRLPVHGPLMPIIADEPKSMSIREYSCPECGYKVPQERIMICQAQDLVDAEIKEPDYLDHCKHHISMRLADFIFKEGLIDFQKGSKVNEYSWRNQYELRGILGVISPRQVATFEQRVKERQIMVAGAVVSEAKKHIRNWGAYYQGDEGYILKDTAIQFLLEALRKIEKEYEKHI